MNALYPDGWVLMQDNASCHVSRSTRNWLAENDVRLIWWPANSPDLNPIENVWGMMKIIISREDLGNLDHFKQVVKNCWEEISHEKLRSFIDSMPQRIEKCIEAKGLTIKH